MIELNKIYNQDCLEGMKLIDDNSIDLIVTDPPYLIKNTTAGGKSKLSKSIQGMNTKLEKAQNLTEGITEKHLAEMLRVMKNINIYIWCNHKQIPQYLDFFVKTNGSNFDILIWNKTNPVPLFCNKYMTDKEYCLYFRKGGYCNPTGYEEAKTVYYQPINTAEKNMYPHPTKKPINIITNIVKNSSKVGETILDPFIGSGTTAVPCIKNERKFIGFEIEKKYFKVANNRIEDELSQIKLF